MPSFIRPAACLAAAASLIFGSLRPSLALDTGIVPQTEAPTSMDVRVDARDAARGVLHVTEGLALAPGPHTLVYPKWIPGDHGPTGPVSNVVGLEVGKGDAAIPWHRDLVDLYAFHIDVPAGPAQTIVRFDFVRAQLQAMGGERLSTPAILTLEWNEVLLVPDVADSRTLTVTPSIVLPGGWTFATALARNASAPPLALAADAATVTFGPVSLEQLVDSPLDAGAHGKSVPLGSIEGAPVDIALFADTAVELDIPEANFARLRDLVREMGALYRARHFDHYTFLLTLSDAMPGEGLEHGQSSDNGTDGNFLHEPDQLLGDADLLAHEMNHSWDGKYRRPASLTTPNFQVPMVDELLWVYEGMTQFYGELQAERSGLLTKRQWLDELAVTYASLDVSAGRKTVSLTEDAVFASQLYNAPRAYSNARRGVDFYDEGELMWLEADGIIRHGTGGKKSIDDFARSFFGGANTGPVVVTYTRADIVAALNATFRYDWAAFFAKRLDVPTPHPPDFLTLGGYRLVYTDKPSTTQKSLNEDRHRLDARFSIGISVFTKDNTVTDVVPGSPAALAGFAPGAKILGVDGATTAPGDLGDALDTALRAARSGGSLTMLLADGLRYREVTLNVTTGPRYPHLERVPGTPDELGAIAAPLPATGYEHVPDATSDDEK